MSKTTLVLKVITPEGLFYEGAATMVEINTTEGEMGVYPGHAPMTVILSAGILKVYEESREVKEAVLSEGFAEVLPEQITILTESVTWQ